MKKLLSMLMAIVLVIGLVPVVAASAAGTDPHECNLDGYAYNGNGTHRVYCTICNGTQTESTSCVWESGVCICGSTKPAEPACDHASNNWGYAPVDKTHHNVKCLDCGKVVSESTPCVFDGGKCICGNVAGTSCDHTGVQDCIPVDATHHKVVCHKCAGVLSESVDCVFENGNPCACGNKAPVACDHVGVHDCIPVDGTHHKVVCPKCKEVLNESVDCVFETGTCACGNKAPAACDHMGNHWKYIPHGTTHHDVWCKDCDTLVTEKAECVFTDGVCLACGNVKKTQCDHVGVQDCIPLDGTHHKVVCPKCGATVEECVNCVFETGVCACGNKKPVHGNTNDKNLDKVPKTGDALAPVMILSGLMSAAGFVTKKRFF